MQVQGAPGATTVTKVFPDRNGKNPFQWLTGIDFDRAGNLYLADRGAGTITMVPPPFDSFMQHDESYRKKFIVRSGLSDPLALKLSADGRGYIVVDAAGYHIENFGISGRLWDNAAQAPLADATLLVDNALVPVKTDMDGFFTLPNIVISQGAQEVKLKVVASDGRTQVIPSVHLDAYGHTALLQDLTFDPPVMPKLDPIPPAGDSSVIVDPDPLPYEVPIPLASSNLGQTQTRHITIPDRRVYPASSSNPPPLPPPASVTDTLGFAPAPPAPPSAPAPSAPSLVQPSVTVVSPADGMITQAGSVTVTGMVETTENLTTVTLTVNGVDQQLPLSNGVFSASVALKDGFNVISARAGDVATDTTNNISYLEGRSLPVKVQKGAALSPSLDFSGVVMRSDGIGFTPYVDLIVTLYAMTDAGSGEYRILGAVSVGVDGLYQFHLENGASASAVLQTLFQLLGQGNAVPVKVVVSDPRS